MTLRDVWEYLKHPPWYPSLEGKWLLRYQGGYVVDRRIVALTFFFVSSLVLFGVANINGGDVSRQWYVHCDSSFSCQNPLYCGPGGDCLGGRVGCPDTLCDLAVLPGGFSHGSPPSPLLNHLFLLIFLTVGMGLILNHLVHNRDFVFSGET